MKTSNNQDRNMKNNRPMTTEVTLYDDETDQELEVVVAFYDRPAERDVGITAHVEVDAVWIAISPFGIIGEWNMGLYFTPTDYFFEQIRDELDNQVSQPGAFMADERI